MLSEGGALLRRECSAGSSGDFYRRSCRRCTPATLAALKGFPTPADALS